MQVVVTGATSFIGAATVKKLMEAGHRVFAVVRPASSNMKHLETIEAGNTPGSLSICPLDLAEIRTLHGFLADAWVHIGWDGAGSDNRTKRDVQQRNVTYALDAVDAAAALGCQRFLFTGSQAEYGVWHRTVAEDTPVIRCLNMARQRWIFAKKQKYFANRRIWSIFIRGYTVCTVRGTIPGLWCSPACAPGRRAAA